MSIQLSGYLSLDNVFHYCHSDICVDQNKKCIIDPSGYECFLDGWINGIESAINLSYLYTEIDAPDNYFSDYPRICTLIDWSNTPVSTYSTLWWWWGWSFSSNISNIGSSQNCNDTFGDCSFVRIKNCKTPNFLTRITSENTSEIDGSWGCSLSLGKSLENRCCIPRDGSDCVPGSCGYIIKKIVKSYAIDYELVNPAYICSTTVSLPSKSCTGHPTIINDKYYSELSRIYCTMNSTCEAKDPISGKSCDDKNNLKFPKKFTTIESEDIDKILWSYNPSGCINNGCNQCYNYESRDCTLPCAGVSSSSTPSWWKNLRRGNYTYSHDYRDNIGSDCCDQSLPEACPKLYQDNYSEDTTWYAVSTNGSITCSTQKEGFIGGPYASLEECFSATITESDRCYPPQATLWKGLCCDIDFMKELNDKVYPLDNSCYEQHPTTTVERPLLICKTSNGIGLEKKINVDYCGYKKKYTEMVQDQFQYITQHLSCDTSYLPTKAYLPLLNCLQYICDCPYGQDCLNSYWENSLNDCMGDIAAYWTGNRNNISFPTAADPIVKRTTVFHPEEILEQRSVSINVVFCGMSTFTCVE